jgi:hypothetical protein
MNCCTECQRGFEQATKDILDQWMEENNEYDEVYGLMRYYRNFPRLENNTTKIALMEDIIEATFDYIDLLENNSIAYDQYAAGICHNCIHTYDFNRLAIDADNFIYNKLFKFIKENIDIFEKCDDESIQHVKFQLEHIIKFFNHEFKKNYKEIFGIPYELRNCKIPLEHYNLRQFHYFDDVIAGHPMASDGWYAEGLQELVDMGVIVD